MDAMTTNFATLALASRLRAHAVRMTNAAKASHIGSCLSISWGSLSYATISPFDKFQLVWFERMP